MFVAYVIRNLDNGKGNLEILGCSDTPQGVLDFLIHPILENDDEFKDYGDWNILKNSDYKINDECTREYGYQKVPFVNEKAELPVIPKAWADTIEEYKANHYRLDEIFTEWSWNYDEQELIARAWLDGYQVEADE